MNCMFLFSILLIVFIDNFAGKNHIRISIGLENVDDIVDDINNTIGEYCV